MPKPPFQARRPDTCETCAGAIKPGDEVLWGNARGAVVHTACPPQAGGSAQPEARRDIDDGSSALEKTAFRLFEALCKSGASDWDPGMLAAHSFKLAEAFFKERARRRKSAQGELPIGYES